MLNAGWQILRASARLPQLVTASFNGTDSYLQAMGTVKAVTDVCSGGGTATVTADGIVLSPGSALELTAVSTSDSSTSSAAVSRRTVGVLADTYASCETGTDTVDGSLVAYDFVEDYSTGYHVMRDDQTYQATADSLVIDDGTDVIRHTGVVGVTASTYLLGASQQTSFDRLASTDTTTSATWTVDSGDVLRTRSTYGTVMLTAESVTFEVAGNVYTMTGGITIKTVDGVLQTPPQVTLAVTGSDNVPVGLLGWDGNALASPATLTAHATLGVGLLAGIDGTSYALR